MASVLASRSAAKGRRLNIGSTNASDAYTKQTKPKPDARANGKNRRTPGVKRLNRRGSG